MEAIRQLHTLTASKKAVYVISRRQAAPGAYFGSLNQHPDSEPSSVFVFRSRGLAEEVARGLEAYRDAVGEYPDVTLTQMDLDVSAPRRRDLVDLAVQELGLRDALNLVRGSGLALSFLYETDAATIRAVDVRPAPRPDRRWLEKLLHQQPADAAPQPQPSSRTELKRRVASWAWAYVAVMFSLVLTAAR